MIVGYITVAGQRQYKMETLNDMGIAAYKYKTERIRTTCLRLRCNARFLESGGYFILIAMALVVIVYGL